MKGAGILGLEGWANPGRRPPKGSKFEGKGGKGLKTRELGLVPLLTRPHQHRASNPGVRGRDSGAALRSLDAALNRCPCIYAAGTLYGRELHLQSLCHHGRDRDECQNYPKPPHWVSFSFHLLGSLLTGHPECHSGECKHRRE